MPNERSKEEELENWAKELARKEEELKEKERTLAEEEKDLELFFGEEIALKHKEEEIRRRGEEYNYYMNEYPLSREEKEMLWNLLISKPKSWYNFFGHPYVPFMLIEKTLK